MNSAPDVYARGLSYEEVAARWSVSTRHAKRLVRQHRIPMVRLGHRTVRMRLEDVERAEVRLLGGKN